MKILKSRRALSPVVASIILIAVTVAVSIAVAAWMGALSFSFMGSGETLNVGSPYAWAGAATSVSLDVSVPSGSAVTLDSLRINNGTAITLTTGMSSSGSLTIQPVNKITLTITGTPAFTSGYSYQFILVTSKNHEFQSTGICP
jgi:flagellin-like protein